jgi:hypothetical protein
MRAESDAGVEMLALKLSQCAVCSQRHVLPQILPCMHSFCSACLAGERATECVSGTQCPVCGLDAAYAVSGVVASDLIAVATAAIGTSNEMTCGECSSNPARVWCRKCQVALCSPCHSVTHASRLFQGHPLEPAECRKQQQPMPKCPAHPHEHVAFIARDGATLMCRDCVLIGAEAGGAPADLVQGARPLSEAASEARARVQAVVEVSQRRGMHVRDIQRSVAGVVGLVQGDYERTCKGITAKADSMALSVDSRHNALQAVLEEWKESEVAESERLVARLRVAKAGLGNAAQVATVVAHNTDELQALMVMGELYPHLSALAALSFPTIHDYPIRPVPIPTDCSEQMNGMATMKRGERGLGGGEQTVSQSWEGVPAGLNGVRNSGVICALGGSDGSRDLSGVDLLRLHVRPAMAAQVKGAEREGGGAGGAGGGNADNDHGEGEWVQGVAMPATRRASACALLGDALYVVGGWDGKEASDSVFVFRRRPGGGGEGVGVAPQGWGWESVAPLLNRRQALACAVLHERLYAVGGYDGTSNLRFFSPAI